MQPVLEVKNLRAAYGAREILKGVSFSLNADDFFAIIGPSGAGKSTLIRCVNRLVEPSGGGICFNGRDIVKVPVQELREVRRNIGMIFQEFNLIERLSVMDNVLTGLILVASTAYLYVASGRVYGVAGWSRSARSLLLAFAVGVIVVGYRFAIFVVTLYTT